MYQLISQAALLALASGIAVGEMLKAETALPSMLVLSVPIAFVFTLLYVVEDRLVVQFCAYIHDLSFEEKKLFAETPCLKNAEQFLKEADYGSRVLPMRFMAQMMSFFLLPAGLSYYRLCIADGIADQWRGIEVVVSAVLLAGILLILIYAAFKHSRFDREIGSRPDCATPAEDK